MAEQQFGIQEMTDEKICSDELKLYNSSMASKSEIIQAAATKLLNSDKYKKADIANRIVKLFPDWKRSTIYDSLESDYKREYESDTPDPHTMTLLEEIFQHYIDTCDNVKKFSKAVIKRINESEQMKSILETILVDSIHRMHEQNFIETINKELSSIRHLKDFVEFMKKMAFDSQLMADKTDSRQKIDMGLKLGLKLKLTQQLPSDLAKKLKISPKWASQIDNDSSVMEFIEKVQHCPKCNFNFSEYINTCNLAHQKGLPLPDIEID